MLVKTKANERLEMEETEWCTISIGVAVDAICMPIGRVVRHCVGAGVGR